VYEPSSSGHQREAEGEEEDNEARRISAVTDLIEVSVICRMAHEKWSGQLLDLIVMSHWLDEVWIRI
jgi:hypothetical protein